MCYFFSCYVQFPPRYTLIFGRLASTHRILLSETCEATLCEGKFDEIFTKSQYKYFSQVAVLIILFVFRKEMKQSGSSKHWFFVNLFVVRGKPWVTQFKQSLIIRGSLIIWERYAVWEATFSTPSSWTHFRGKC